MSHTDKQHKPRGSFEIPDKVRKPVYLTIKMSNGKVEVCQFTWSAKDAESMQRMGFEVYKPVTIVTEYKEK